MVRVIKGFCMVKFMFNTLAHFISSTFIGIVGVIVGAAWACVMLQDIICEQITNIIQ